MAINVLYNNIGKGVALDGTTFLYVYGVDFNPTEPTRPEWDNISVIDPSTTFDLSGFQMGHEVGCGAIQLRATSSYSGVLYLDFEIYHVEYEQWRRSAYYAFNLDVSSGGEWGGYYYFGVDMDEIRPGYTRYRLHYYTADGVVDFYSPEFTVSNLSIDSKAHKSGYFWVEGSHLCYIDGSRGGTLDAYGYKHKIAYDSGYATPSAGEPGYVWLESGDNLRIYYIDEYGTKRRTYSSDAWYGGNVNVGSSSKGYIWVSNGTTAADGYCYLCFIAPNGSKRRILNGPPIGYS